MGKNSLASEEINLGFRLRISLNDSGARVRHCRESGKVVGAGLNRALTTGFRLSQTR